MDDVHWSEYISLCRSVCAWNWAKEYPLFTSQIGIVNKCILVHARRMVIYVHAGSGTPIRGCPYGWCSVQLYEEKNYEKFPPSDSPLGDQIMQQSPLTLHFQPTSQLAVYYIKQCMTLA